MRDRLDRTLVARGLVSGRDEAGRLILAGMVRVNGHTVDKPATRVAPDSDVQVLQPPSRYVSRGGDKLSPALDHFGIDVQGRIALDVGCSTGGFTDCLLQRGAKLVYAVDVGYGQFDWRLRQDPRVVLIERTNIRELPRSAILHPIEIAVIDVSFISLVIVLPCVIPFLGRPATVVALVKPQFEVGKGRVGRGGIVRDEALRSAVSDKIQRSAEELGLLVNGSMDSPVHGRKGNREMLMSFSLPRIDSVSTHHQDSCRGGENALRSGGEGVGCHG
ncbi:MAG TPA: TlyA family RNA methyltransferase [Nitrospiraceae bacterium]|nr:TlyA family RNA methyltransferase [Nitrospiraceae bacterium]